MNKQEDIKLEKIGSHSYCVKAGSELLYRGDSDKMIKPVSSMRHTNKKITYRLGHIRVIVQSLSTTRKVEIFEDLCLVMSFDLSPHEPLTA